MFIFPAIDLYDKKAVRLFKGDYSKMTVYSDNPLQIAKDFENNGAKFLHTVDLEGAKFGETKNFDVIKSFAENTGLFIQVGGGIRNMATAEKYISSGADRIILGTAAVTNQSFLKEVLKNYGDKIAVGADIKDGYVAINGWEKKSSVNCANFFENMSQLGVKTVICTDISKDGAMMGTNLSLYESLSQKFDMQIIASGGVSTLSDIQKLSKMNLYGAIVGKAYYEKTISLKEAIEVAK